ncbi:hypothetical protein P7H19_21625 [Paenibacillus larvae]|nr:hypothetical protein [Paenibacillus larvae]MDT2238354.1 hypothetical protein [Paenibacillus larvae]
MPRYQQKKAKSEKCANGSAVSTCCSSTNYGTDESWEGIDDLSEHKAIFDEIDNRLSQIANILDKHADPAMAIPTGSLEEDDDGQPIFRAGRDKILR